MENNDRPEISALNNIYINYNVEIQVSRPKCLGDKKDYPSVSLKLGGRTFEMYADDEQDYFTYNYPLLNLCIVLRELEYYIETEDYLVWCTELKLDSTNEQVLAYFRGLATIYREVESIIGKIDSQISDWDFEMGSGAMYALRKIAIK